MNVDRTYKERFYSFLESRNITEEYLTLLSSYQGLVTFNESDDWIESQLTFGRHSIFENSFDFDHTAEGRDFWKVISNEWELEQDFLTVLTFGQEQTYKEFCRFLKVRNLYITFIKMLAKYSGVTLLRYVKTISTIADMGNMVVDAFPWEVCIESPICSETWRKVSDAWKECCKTIKIF